MRILFQSIPFHFLVQCRATHPQRFRRTADIAVIYIQGFLDQFLFVGFVQQAFSARFTNGRIKFHILVGQQWRFRQQYGTPYPVAKLTHIARP